ncbi:MAG: biopolymer transporter ExbD [Neisseriaceae bacterium]
MTWSVFEEDKESLKAEINVTPLVDVMLVLLVVFIIAMPILTYTIPISLPSTSLKAENELPAQVLRISIDAKGHYFLDKKAVSSTELLALEQENFKKNPELVLAISADELVAYRHVIEVLETAKKVGIKKIGFVTKKDSS